VVALESKIEQVCEVGFAIECTMAPVDSLDDFVVESECTIGFAIEVEIAFDSIGVLLGPGCTTGFAIEFAIGGESVLVAGIIFAIESRFVIRFEHVFITGVVKVMDVVIESRSGM
jgi:hypothetical protein